MFDDIFRGQTVLITGHTGFKGAWLSEWLLALGAHVVGFSLPEPVSEPNLFTLLGLADRVADQRGDIRDAAALAAVVKAHRPVAIFHLAALPIVPRAVQEPQLTYEVNTLGTVNVLEAVRATDSVRAVVCITTDKVYEEQGFVWGYREPDRLGGRDPYSASKAMAELAVASYRATYFPPERYAEHGVALATARAGNVIGGGDFGDHRLVPDCLRALMRDQTIPILTPGYIRPWQHVLVPLSGYLWLAARMLAAGAEFGEAWNFGPQEQKGVSVQQIAERLIALWGSGRWEAVDPALRQGEGREFRLNWDKAAARLDWQPAYGWGEALAEIVTWFKAYEAGDADMAELTRAHLAAFIAAAAAQGQPWVSPDDTF
ncbi:MAG: CDP-glucose 4,6-dehydratase [Ardenticatenales bacterium]|nr:CDP-glucose 4,6-dehydratase [Ardenticatenales bacterium]